MLSDYPDYDHLINHVSVQLEGNGDDDDHDHGDDGSDNDGDDDNDDDDDGNDDGDDDRDDDDDYDFGRLGDLDDGFSAINSYLIGDMFVLKYDTYMVHKVVLYDDASNYSEMSIIMIYALIIHEYMRHYVWWR